MATAREQHTATLLADGSVLVTGGFDGARPLAGAERYDPRTRSWSRAERLAVARGAHTATRLADDRILVAGGFTAAGATTEAELYDPAGRTRMPAAAMVGARESHTATLLPDGDVAVAGGNSTAGPTSTVELYDPRSGAWTATSSMATARYAHVATLLATGRLLVTGGYARGGVTASVEIYDPASDVWWSAPSMALPRDQHTSALLPTGTVLLAGGRSGSASVARAERYVPRAATAIVARVPSAIVIGAAASATATVGGQLRPTSGDVTFETFKPADTTCSNVPGFISSVRIDAGGSATSKPLRPTAPGTWRVVARYSGDANNDDARSACDDPSAHLVVGTGRPSIATSPAGGLGAGRLADTARVDGRVDQQPGATIGFRLYGPGDPACASEPVFESVVRYPPAGGDVTSGVVTPAVPGTYRWRASYSGDASNAAVDGPCGDATTTTWSLQRWRLPDG
jgi:hypothetical protein